MSTILPPLSVAQPPATGAAAAALLAAAGGPLPEAIAGLPPGAVVNAVVMPQPGLARGMVEVMTNAGVFMLRGRGEMPLPDGARLGLQVVQAEGQTLFRLVSVNGRPLAGAGMPAAAGPAIGLPTPAVATPEGGAPEAAAAAGTTPASPSPPLGLPATLVRPAAAATTATAAAGTATASPPAPSGGLPPDLPAGTVLTVRIAAVGAPAAAPSAAATVSPPAAPFPAPAAPAAAPPPPTSTPSLAGTVTSHVPGGQALVETGIGTLSLPAVADLPEGAPVVLDVVAPPLLPTPPKSAVPTAGPGQANWQSLAETMQTLAGADQPQAAEQMMRLLPQLGPRLAANLSVMASALASGQVRALVGEGPLRGLERAGRKDLAHRLGKDLDALDDEPTQARGNGDWRGMTLPLWTGAQIDPIHLYVRRPPADEDETAGGRHKGDEHRFLLEISLTRLGRMQFDGLVQREAKRFDLIIRTAQPLPEEMRRDILGLFASTAEVVGTKGTVVFQGGGQFVELPPAPAGTTRFSV